MGQKITVIGPCRYKGETIEQAVGAWGNFCFHNNFHEYNVRQLSIVKVKDIFESKPNNDCGFVFSTPDNPAFCYISIVPNRSKQGFRETIAVNELDGNYPIEKRVITKVLQHASFLYPNAARKTIER